MQFRILFAALLFVSLNLSLTAQEEDLLSMVEQPKETKAEKVYATFKTSKIISAQTIETVKKNCLDFRITHRFGDMGVANAAKTFWGIDNANDIRISFDYGITNDITVGIGRSKYNEMIDGSVKWRILKQSKDFKMPVSVALYSCMGVTPMDENNIYQGLEVDNKRFEHRMNYYTELIIASKITDWFSLQVSPGYSHRNFVKAAINYDNGNAEEQNGLFVVGVGGRVRLTKRFCLVADYYHVFSKFREKNLATPYFDPLAVGIEIETGGHVFHINVTNSPAILANNFLPNTQDSWSKGKFKYGFNISRVFAF